MLACHGGRRNGSGIDNGATGAKPVLSMGDEKPVSTGKEVAVNPKYCIVGKEVEGKMIALTHGLNIPLETTLSFWFAEVTHSFLGNVKLLGTVTIQTMCKNSNRNVIVQCLWMYQFYGCGTRALYWKCQTFRDGTIHTMCKRNVMEQCLCMYQFYGCALYFRMSTSCF